jgi:hypothetical protein
MYLGVNFRGQGNGGDEDLDDARLEQEQERHADEAPQRQQDRAEQGEVNGEEAQAQGQREKDQREQGDESREFLHGDHGRTLHDLAGVSR